MTTINITYLTLHRYNRYNSLFVVYKYNYIYENGSSGDALTDSFVPVDATTEQIIRNHILPSKNWASATYNNQTYYIGTANPAFIEEIPNKPLICGSLGDVLGDGQIGMDDALAIAQYTVGTKILTSEQLQRANVSGDETVNIIDALMIAQYLSNTRTTFPACSVGGGEKKSDNTIFLLIGAGMLALILLGGKK